MTTPKCADILRSALRRPPLLFCLRGGRRYANCSAGRGRGYRSTTPPTSSTTTTATTTATAGDVVRRTRRRLRGVAITGTEEAVRRAEEMVLRLSGEAAGDGASDGGGGGGGGGGGAGNAFGDSGFVADGAPRWFEPPGAFYVTHPPPPPLLVMRGSSRRWRRRRRCPTRPRRHGTRRGASSPQRRRQTTPRSRLTRSPARGRTSAASSARAARR